MYLFSTKYMESVDDNMNKISKRIGYALFANIINALATLVISFAIPKIVSVEEYGLFQVYFFYVSYVGFFHFGLCDGILLREGGNQYSKLNFNGYHTQFRLLVIVDISIAAFLSLIACFWAGSTTYVYIYVMVALNIVVLCAQTFFLYILQSTNRIKEYAAVTVTYRLFFIAAVLLLILLGGVNMYWLILFDFAGKVVSLFMGVYWCKEVLKSPPAPFISVKSEMKENVLAGSQLLLANISGLLCSGIVKIGIQYNWSIEEYAKVSLAITISHVFLTVVNAVSLVAYPVLRNTDKDNLKEIFPRLRDGLVYFLSLCLIFYYPVKEILSIWLPKYQDSLRYLAIIFPLCIYATKTSMIINTYQKVLRMEKEILRSNFIGIIVSLITTVISVNIIGSIELAMISIVFTAIIRMLYSEYKLYKILRHRIVGNAIEEICITIAFIYANWQISGVAGLLIYAGVVLVICLIHLKNIKSAIKFFVKGTAAK